MRSECPVGLMRMHIIAHVSRQLKPEAQLTAKQTEIPTPGSFSLLSSPENTAGTWVLAPPGAALSESPLNHGGGQALPKKRRGQQGRGCKEQGPRR